KVDPAVADVAGEQPAADDPGRGDRRSHPLVFRDRLGLRRNGATGLADGRSWGPPRIAAAGLADALDYDLDRHARGDLPGAMSPDAVGDHRHDRRGAVRFEPLGRNRARVL